jgi:DNA mismatch repair protein MutH
MEGRKQISKAKRAVGEPAMMKSPSLREMMLRQWPTSVDHVVMHKTHAKDGRVKRLMKEAVSGERGY